MPSHGIDHRHVAVGGTSLHVASAGNGAPVLLVHGFPETWRVFAGLIDHLADDHHVLAVDLPGFGDSEPADDPSSAGLAAVLAALLDDLALGPVHLVGQDVSGPLTYRLVAARPDLVATWTAIETVLPGFGWEALTDVAHGGAWYIGMLAAPGAPELLLDGRERAFLGDHVLTPQTVVPGAVTADLLDDLAGAYHRSGFAGAAALYRSLLAEGEDLQRLAAEPLTLPVLAVSGSAGEFVPASLRPVAPDLVHAAVPDVGHYVALEAARALADVLVPHFASG